MTDGTSSQRVVQLVWRGLKVAVAPAKYLSELMYVGLSLAAVLVVGYGLVTGLQDSAAWLAENYRMAAKVSVAFLATGALLAVLGWVSERVEAVGGEDSD